MSAQVPAVTGPTAIVEVDRRQVGMPTPLLGMLPTLTNYAVVLLVTIVNIVLGIIFFARYRVFILHYALRGHKAGR